MANKLPTAAGTIIYASQNDVYMYQEANIDSNKLRKIGSGVVTFSKGDEIGQFTGNKNGSFYEATYTYQYNILPFVKRTVSITGWFLGLQITTETKEEMLLKDAQAKDDELEKYLAKVAADANTPKNVSGNGSGEDSGKSSLSTTNIILGVAVITAIGLIIAGLFKRNFKVNK